VLLIISNRCIIQEHGFHLHQSRSTENSPGSDDPTMTSQQQNRRIPIVSLFVTF
jgi:hypothetical protein